MTGEPRDGLPAEEPAQPPAWPPRPSSPQVTPTSNPEVAPQTPRSIFNRFRRGHPTPDEMQQRLAFPEDDVASAPVDDAPPLEPARPPRRPGNDAPDQEAGPPAGGPPAATPAGPAPRPLPPIEAILPSARDALPSAPPPVEEEPAEPTTAIPVSVSEAPVVPSAWARVATPPATAPDAAGADEDVREGARGWLRTFRPVPVPVNPYMVLLTGLATLVMLSYVLVEPSPRWSLILGAIAVAGGLDGTLRATWRVTFADRDTTAALFMPAIYMLAIPPLIEQNVRGFGVVPAALAAGLGLSAIVAAQVGSARPGADYYPWARTVSTAGVYAAAFASFALTYVYHLDVTAAAVAAGLVAAMLATEVLREGEVDATETVGYAIATGVAVGQWRLALHYLPVDGYLAGLAVLLGFLVVTGLLQAYITRGLDRRTVLDHAVVAAAGALLVIGARVTGLA